MQVKKGYFNSWHCIVPYGQGHEYEQVRKIVSWCRTNLTQGRWGYEDLHKETSFILYREEDVVKFSLRWS